MSSSYEYLPYEIPNAEVLITVKTYPLPSNKYGELVCTAGFLHDGKWIRIYPVPFLDLPYEKQYSKYQWITLDLVKNTDDFRPESYRPRKGAEYIQIGKQINTDNYWEERKKYAFKETFSSMKDVIVLSRDKPHKSLATLKPLNIVDFVIEEQEDREWPPQWRDHMLQAKLFQTDTHDGKRRQPPKKLPYKYYYKFRTQGDKEPRQLMIEDWEIGRLYWRMLAECQGDERAANQKVQQKYFYEFCSPKHDLYFFLGTTQEYQRRRANNPFIIVGLFYPLNPDDHQKNKNQKKRRVDSVQASQLELF